MFPYLLEPKLLQEVDYCLFDVNHQVLMINKVKENHSNFRNFIISYFS